ncbi:MAG: TIGR04442 family protein [Desulfuromonas sp.]
MHQELRLHGHIDDAVEYFVTVAGRDAQRFHFYERSGDGLRIFAPGNEIRLDATGLTHWGNGGSFCAYMHGVEQPLADLLKKDVCNRLVLFGARYRDNGELQFSSDTGGRIPYDSIFEEGHAISNCFFFVTGSVYGALATQQEGLLCLLGKILKRTARVAESDDARLVDELFGLLGHKSYFYLLRLIHKKHLAYQELFRDLYFRYRAIPDGEFERLRALAQRLDISQSQQRRIRIAVMYSHRDNRPVVDEYRDILVDCHLRGAISRQENARLTRLKTLATRNKIPPALFEPLDRHLRYDKLVDQEQDYIAATREILSGLLQDNPRLSAVITREDLVRLLHSKRQALLNRDYLFDQIVLETSRICDERVHGGADIALAERLRGILDAFDHFERCLKEINNLAFMVTVRIQETMLTELQRSYRQFERLQPGLFEDLLLSDVLCNRFLGSYGRRKLLCLREALRAGTARAVLLAQLQQITDEERLHGQLLHLLKQLLQADYVSDLQGAAVELLRQQVLAAVDLATAEQRACAERLFRQLLVQLETERYYLQQLLPRILRQRLAELREDFLLNSGLDRFYVEELENAYVARTGLATEVLEQLRRQAAEIA